MNVTVYTTKTCASCRTLKQWLIRKGVDFHLVDIEENLDERDRIIRLTGQLTVPVTVIDSDIVIGWNPERLIEALKI